MSYGYALRQTRLLACLFLALILCSCSTARKADLPEYHQEEPSLFEDGFRHYKGAVHLHTNYSGDTDAPPSELRDALIRHRMDYAIITDHNTLDGKKLLEGFHERTLWLFGNEISSSAGKYLAINSSATFPEDREFSKVFSEVKQSGGMGFIAHPFGKREPWQDWTVRGFTGLEIYDAADDLYDEFPLWLGALWLSTPKPIFGSLVFDRPRKALELWDQLTQERRTVGIAGNDAHGNIRIGNHALASYEFMIGQVTTYLLSKRLDASHIYEALADGRAYIAFERLGDARPFMFHAINGSEHAVMGEEIAYTPETELRVYVPRKAKMTLFKNGMPYTKGKGLELRVPVGEPGVYRVEVWRGRRLWIISNPIYVRD